MALTNHLGFVVYLLEPFTPLPSHLCPISVPSTFQRSLSFHCCFPIQSHPIRMTPGSWKSPLTVRQDAVAFRDPHATRISQPSTSERVETDLEATIRPLLRLQIHANGSHPVKTLLLSSNYQQQSNICQDKLGSEERPIDRPATKYSPCRSSRRPMHRRTIKRGSLMDEWKRFHVRYQNPDKPRSIGLLPSRTTMSDTKRSYMKYC